MPQGLVLGLRMFIMYTSDLADLVADFQVNFHSFADDLQVFMHKNSSNSFRSSRVASAVHKLKDCITEIERWMLAS